jgi:hypothetical protein
MQRRALLIRKREGVLRPNLGPLEAMETKAAMELIGVMLKSPSDRCRECMMSLVGA